MANTGACQFTAKQQHQL